MNVTGLWGCLKKDKDFFEYFPDIFHKRNPPREYFWKIYSVMRKKDWKKSVQTQIQRMKDANIIKPDRSSSRKKPSIYLINLMIQTS